MNGLDELLGLVAQPVTRRCWLLFKALEELPLDRAIDVARSAEAFITGASPNESHVCTTTVRQEPAAPSIPTEKPAINVRPSRASSDVQPVSEKRAGLNLSPEDREHLLRRLAQGARNAELANEFGLSRQQVQGLRMGCAREIAEQRKRFNLNQPRSDQTPDVGVADDVVRYLRQQDDVVVPVENGEFLVNGRFRMVLGDLVARANRMRARQGKPEFQLSSCLEMPPENLASANKRRS